MLFSHSQNGVTDCKGASVGKTCGRENAAAPLLGSFRPPPERLNTRDSQSSSNRSSSAEEPLEELRDPPPILTQISVGNSGRRWAGGSGTEE